MKKQFLTVLILCLASANAFAGFPQVRPSPGPGGTIQEINAQVAITRNGIDGLLTKIGQNSAPTSYSLKDYWRLNPAFRKKIEYALVNFEETLKKGILEGTAAPVMNEYNSLYLSTAFGETQKELLIKQQRARINEVFGEIAKAYRLAVIGAIRDAGFVVYMTDTNLTYHRKYSANSYSKLRKELFRCTDYDCNNRKSIGESTSRCEDYYCYDPTTYRVVNPGRYKITTRGDDISERHLLDIVGDLRDGCASQLCVILRASDHLATIGLMRTLFEREIRMKLADGTPVGITPEKFTRLDSLTSLLSQTEKFKLTDLPLDAK